MPTIKYKTKRQRHKATENQKNEYKKRAMTAYTFKFHNVSDSDVIAKINEQDNKADYIRFLVREDISKNG